VEALAFDGAPRGPLLDAARGRDLVVLHKRLLPWPAFRRLRRNAARLLYDFDDALYFRPGPRHRSLSREARFFRTVEAADLVTAGNRLLAGVARLRARRVFVVPTTVDVEQARFPEEKEEGFVVVWIGQGATRPHLETVRGALLEAGKGIPGFRLRTVCDRPVQGAEFVPWSLEAEGPALARAHAGVMPLPDEPFARGKCGYKLLQYYAHGLPAIASPVGVNRLLASGGGALLARGPEEWKSALFRLASDPALRASLGARGRDFAARRYASSALERRLAAILDEACGRSPTPASPNATSAGS
jgi:glycosyltransferase involved in cell wall biosynthesis